VQTAAQASAGGGTRYAKARAAIRRRLTAEHLAVLVAGLLVLAVHDVGYVLSQPFWNDETWVAVTTRFPLSQLPVTTSSTPIGWSLLQRVFTVSGGQTSRLLPLAFAGVAVVVGYWLARGLGWRRKDASVAAGLLAATGVLLVPGMLVRDDLKQFTADACAALLTLALTSRLEREWSHGGLAALSVSAWGGMLFSGAAAFMGVAAFAAVCIVQLARRSWGRLIEAVVAAGITAILMALVFEAFDARADTPSLHTFFNSWYLPVSRGLHGDVTFVVAHFKAVGGLFGLGPWWAAVPLVAAGLVTMFRLGRPATAVAIAALWPEMLALSALRVYPFLNQPTATFLYPVMAVAAAIGVAGVCYGAVTAALAQALALARQHSCARIWLVRAFVQGHEQIAWKLALSKRGLTPQNLGHGGLSVIQPASPGCR
jgi:hypothetical protein